jgi:hypothetical protein
MIARARVRNSEPHWHLLQKPHLRQRRGLGLKVIAHEEHDLVLAHRHFIGRQQRRIRAPVGIGLGGGDERALFAFQRPEFDLHSGSRTTMRGVQNVRAQFGGHKSVVS